jgi:hypothetical protein
MPRFKHPPLASATNEIRLLSLDPSGDLDDIHCTLVTHRLDAQPVYCALSYEWGDPDLPMEIKVNGNVFHARHNLWLFLHRLKAARRSQGKTSWGPASKLWIDALCIDQTDLAERSAQVQLMGTIFQKACGVIVWLGWSDGLDPAVTSTLAKEIASDPVYGHKSYSDLLLNGPCQQIDVHDEATIQQVCDFILHLCKKTYWTRRWIVQEILMAQKVLLVYGEQEIPWAAVCMMFERYTSYTSTRSDREEPNCYGLNLSSLKDLLETTASKVWTHQNMRKGPNPSTDLSTLLHDYRSLQCEAFHDRIYALQSLTTDEVLDTDYSISSLTLYSRFLTSLLRRQDKSAFRDWRNYAADCGLDVQSLGLLPESSAQEQSISMGAIVPLRTAYEFCVVCQMDLTTFLELTTFQQGVKAFDEAEKSGNRSSGLFSHVSTEIKRFSGLNRFEYGLLRTRVGKIGPLDDGDAARPYAMSTQSELSLIAAPNIKHDPSDETPQPPTVLLCSREFVGEVGRLAVTWSSVDGGDLLCQIAGRCYLILRQDGEHLQIIGTAWMLLSEGWASYLDDDVREIFGYSETRDEGAWEMLCKAYFDAKDVNLAEFRPSHNGGSETYFEPTEIEVLFDVVELLQLIQVTEETMKVTFSDDWAFPCQDPLQPALAKASKKPRRPFNGTQANRGERPSWLNES